MLTHAHMELLRAVAHGARESEVQRQRAASVATGVLLECGYSQPAIDYAVDLELLGQEDAERARAAWRAFGDRWGAPSTWWEGARFPPRAWQRQALPAVISSACVAGLESQGPPGVLCRAIMGAGKSVLLTELAHLYTGPGVVVVSTSTQALVRQLTEDIAYRVGPLAVGQFYAGAKQVRGRRVIVACNDSMPKLASELEEAGQLVGLLIVDECHKSEADGIKGAVGQMCPSFIVGLTATPYRAGGERLSLFDAEAFSYDASAALADGVVVPWRIVPWGGEEVELDRACVQLVQQATGPGVVTADSIADAEAFTELLQAAGVEAVCVHSKQKVGAADKALRDLKAGRIKAVVAVNMLTEGVNVQEIMWLVLRRAMSSPVAFAQLVGRALRSCPRLVWGQYQKTAAVLYDPWNLFDTHRLSLPAALGAGQEEELEEEGDAPEDDYEVAAPLEDGPGEPRMPKRTRALAGASVYLMRLAVAAGTLGMTPQPKAWGRRLAPTIKQGRYLERLAHGHRWRGLAATLPERHLEELRYVYACRGQLSRGQVSDLIELFQALPRHGWSDALTHLMDQHEEQEP